MSRKVPTILLCITVVLLISARSVFAADPNSTESKLKRVGIGFQFSFPVWGASVMVNASEKISVQGVLGIFGDLKVYGARFLYRFQRKEHLNVYGYGMVGGFSYTGYAVNEGHDYWDWRLEEKTETVLGYGAGAGVEYYFKGLPEIGWNAEIGFGAVDFKDVDYNFSSFMIGIGAHYYF